MSPSPATTEKSTTAISRWSPGSTARSRCRRGKHRSRRPREPPQVGRHGLVDEHRQRALERHHRLLLTAEAPDRHGPFGRLLLADDQQDRDLGERVLADLVVDLLVAKVEFDPQSE